MIGKVGTGNNFNGLVNYLFKEGKEAEVICSDGLNLTDKKTIIDDFNFQRKQNPNLGNAVFHASISFAPGENPTNELMEDIVQDYVKELDLDNTAYLAVRHYDTSDNHHHLHLVANRVRYDGKTISDSMSAYKSIKCMKRLEIEHNLVRASDRVNKRKEAIKIAIFTGLKKGENLETIFKRVEGLGYEVRLNKSKTTGHISGLTFINNKSGIVWKASDVDRKLSYNNIVKAIEQNKLLVQTKTHKAKPNVLGIPKITTQMKTSPKGIHIPKVHHDNKSDRDESEIKWKRIKQENTEDKNSKKLKI